MSNSGRIIGLDIGEKRVGVAISDPYGIIAQGLETIEVTDDADALNKICRLLHFHQIKKLVIGLPKNMNGSIGLQGAKVQELGESIKQRYPCEIVYYDERLTSKYANAILTSENVSRKKRKHKVDKIAAVLILQDFLNYSKNPTKEG